MKLKLSSLLLLVFASTVQAADRLPDTPTTPMGAIERSDIKRAATLLDQASDYFNKNKCRPSTASKNLEEKKETKWIAGRIMSIRGQGAIIFITLNDGTGNFQGLLKKDILSASKFDFWISHHSRLLFARRQLEA